jgi:hypothetical protein
LRRLRVPERLARVGRPDHPAHQVALAHLQAREQLVAQLLAELDIEDAELAAQLALLVDGAFVVGGSRRDPTAARRAKRVAQALLASHIQRLLGRHGAGSGSVSLFAADVAAALGASRVLYLDPDPHRRGRLGR